MRKLPYHQYDEEDLEIMQSIINKKDAKYRKNETYINASKNIPIRTYDKPPKLNNGTEQ